MPPFISPPRNPSKRIPVITLEDLIAALNSYLPTELDVNIDHVFYGFDRFIGNQTTLTFRDLRGPDWNVVVTIEGKAATSPSSRLWSHPFDLYVERRLPTSVGFFIWITPLPRRAIEIKRIVRWEQGVPYFEDN